MKRVRNILFLDKKTFCDLWVRGTHVASTKKYLRGYSGANCEVALFAPKIIGLSLFRRSTGWS